MESNRSIRMVLASDSMLFSEGIGKVLADEGNIKVVAKASDSKEIEECLSEIKPEFLFLDNTTLNLDIGKLLNTIREKSPNTRVILLGNQTEDKLALPSVICMTKETNSSKLIHTIKRRHLGKGILAKETARVGRTKRKLIPK